MSFNELKNRINSGIAVFIPDFKQKFIISTDASNFGIGAVLQQEINGELRVVNWASKKLTTAEKKKE